jgi:hypothetical protein
MPEILVLSFSRHNKNNEATLTKRKKRRNTKKCCRRIETKREKISTEKRKKKKLRGFGPLANYADRATAACWRSSANFLRIGDVAWSAQRIPPVVSLGFLDRSRHYIFQVAPQLSSRGWVDPVRDSLLLRKSGSAWDRTQDLWICSQKF